MEEEEIDDDEEEDDEEDEDEDEIFDAEDAEFNDIIDEKGVLVGEELLVTEFEAAPEEAQKQTIDVNAMIDRD